jgi:general secretion pathway protein B
MSFILDALKKSEAERNRKSGPVLMDMRIAPPRRQLPIWVWVIATVLVANLALLGYALLRGATKNAAATAPVTATPPAAVAPTTPAAAVSSGALPPPTLPAAGAQVITPANSSPEVPATGGVIMQSNAVIAPGNGAADPAANNGAAAAPPSTAIGNYPTDLPSDDDLRATGVTLPELHLALHVYDDVAANRFVLLNSSRLREGQETAEGVMVERIEPTGVVLSWRGRRFRIHPGN